MSKTAKIIIVGALIISVGAAIILKQNGSSPVDNNGTGLQPSEASSQQGHTQSTKPLPRLVELGGTCVLCKMMQPTLDELSREYAGKLQVDILDVLENPDIGTEYGVQILPTQIFFDASGKEIFRHEGFLPKEDVLAKWRELGVKLMESR
jgi:thioredoxin 1